MKLLWLGMVMIGVLMMGGGAVVAQESTPGSGPPDSFELAPGVIASNMTFVEGQENPSLYRLSFEPGVSYPVQESPSLELVYMESGTMTVRLNATVTVASLNATVGSGESVAAGTGFTLGTGQYFVLAPGVSGEVRNDGEDTATVSIAGMTPGGTTVPAAATPTGEFVTPDPSACLIEPRSLDSVVALLGAPVTGSPATPAMETGSAADADVVATVTALAQESVACFNAGNFLAQFAFYTDDALVALIPPGLTADDLTGFLGAPPEPLPAEARESVMVRDVVILPDGQVTAYFVLRNLEGTFTTFVTLEEQGDGYVITSDIDVEAELATPAA
ncbi:MAG: hypothetical protein H0V37_13930 [Chloroflexia bacterium]|nr:hypothetical protein [Chloroflexia bacterium]